MQFVDRRAAADGFISVNLNYRLNMGATELDISVGNLLGAQINSPDIANFDENLYFPARQGDPSLMLELRWAY